MLGEPQGIDAVFRQQTRRNEVSTKQWADGYLAAFSMAAGIPLVTFDRALAAKLKGAVLLSQVAGRDQGDTNNDCADLPARVGSVSSS